MNQLAFDIPVSCPTLEPAMCLAADAQALQQPIGPVDRVVDGPAPGCADAFDPSPASAKSTTLMAASNAGQEPIPEDRRGERDARGPTTVRAHLEPRIGASGLASCALIHDPALRPSFLAGCFAFVETQPAVAEAFRGELQVVSRRLEQVIGRPLQNIPAAPCELRPIIAELRLNQYPTQHKRWNVASILQSVLILSGWVSAEARGRDELPKDWERLLIAADKLGKRRFLAAFLRHCHRGETPLNAIATQSLLEYIEWTACRTLIADPWKAGAATALTWRYMQSQHPGWPVGIIELPGFRISPFVTRTEFRNPQLISSRLLANRSLIQDASLRPTSLGACLRLTAEHPKVSDSFRRDALSAMALLKRATGRDAMELPTEPELLRPILLAVRPIDVKVTSKRWKNVQAIVRSALTLCGWISAESRKRPVLQEPWAGLLRSAAEHRLEKALAPFFRFCARSGVTPAAITTDTLQSYATWLDQSTLKRSGRHSAGFVNGAWKRMQKLDPHWPVTDLALPTRRIYKRRSDLSEEFQMDVQAYLRSLQQLHLRDSTYRRPFRANSVLVTRNSILRAATFLADSGEPLEKITSVASLVTPETFEKILTLALKDAGGEWNSLSKHIADNLFHAARRWVKPSEAVLKDLDEQRKCVRVLRSVRRRRELTAQFEDKDILQALFALPDWTFQHAEKMLKDAQASTGYKPLQPAARLHETALVLAMLLAQPLRIGNLVSLDLDVHFRRGRSGRFERIYMDPGQVKNSVAIDFPLNDLLLRNIERHLAVFRPLLLGSTNSTALFPGKRSGPMTAQTMSKRIRRLVEQQLGVRFTPHVARHLAAELLLDKDPANLPVAQRLLGHTRPDTTAFIYGQVRTRSAQKFYEKVVADEMLFYSRAKPARKGAKS